MCIEQPNPGVVFIGIEDCVGDDPFAIRSPISDLAAARAAKVLCGVGMFVGSTAVQT
jgi:hypothetical protein